MIKRNICTRKEFKQALNHGLVFEKVYRGMKNQKAWLKLYIDMNTDLAKKCNK